MTPEQEHARDAQRTFLDDMAAFSRPDPLAPRETFASPDDEAVSIWAKLKGLWNPPSEYLIEFRSLKSVQGIWIAGICQGDEWFEGCGFTEAWAFLVAAYTGFQHGLHLPPAYRPPRVYSEEEKAAPPTIPVADLLINKTQIVQTDWIDNKSAIVQVNIAGEIITRHLGAKQFDAYMNAFFEAMKDDPDPEI